MRGSDTRLTMFRPRFGRIYHCFVLSIFLRTLRLWRGVRGKQINKCKGKFSLTFLLLGWLVLVHHGPSPTYFLLTINHSFLSRASLTQPTPQLKCWEIKNRKLKFTHERFCLIGNLRRWQMPGQNIDENGKIQIEIKTGKILKLLCWNVRRWRANISNHRKCAKTGGGRSPAIEPR